MQPALVLPLPAAIAQEAGLGDQVVECGSIIGLPRNGRMHYVEADHRLRDVPGLALSGALSLNAKLRAVRLAFDVIRARKLLTYDGLWRATELDDESAGDYARRVLGDELLDVIIDNVARGVSIAHADEISKAALFFGLANWMGVKLMTFKGGMGSWAETMAPRFEVELETPVTQVEQRGEEVLVTVSPPGGDERTERMAGCVVAVPAGASAAIVPQLDAWRSDFLSSMRYTRTVVLTLAQSRPVDQPAALFLTPRSEAPDVSVITVPNRMAPWRIPAGKGLVTLMCAAPIGDRLIDEDEDTVIERLLPVIEGVHPGLTADVEWCHIDRWDPLLPVHPPGFTRDLTRLRHLCDARDDRIQLAGDYWSLGCVETSTASGDRAARILAARLGRSASGVGDAHARSRIATSTAAAPR